MLVEFYGKPYLSTLFCLEDTISVLEYDAVWFLEAGSSSDCSGTRMFCLRALVYRCVTKVNREKTDLLLFSVFEMKILSSDTSAMHVYL